MKMNNILYLGSQSRSRQQLLADAQIPFIVVEQNADEAQCELLTTLQDLVERIALHKMEHVVLPAAKEEGSIYYVLTADTLSQVSSGKIEGKPRDRADAIAKIKSARSGVQLGTAFCLDKKVYNQGEWQVLMRIQKFVGSEYIFDIPDESIDEYLKKSFSFISSGAVAVEAYGAQFLKTVHGSYSTIVGLPMFELREALYEIGFFNLN